MTCLDLVNPYKNTVQYGIAAGTPGAPNYHPHSSIAPFQLFHSTPSSTRTKPPKQLLQLVGVVCYYGKHYSTFFFHSKVQEWIYFDDAAVKQVLASTCRRHRSLALGV